MFNVIMLIANKLSVTVTTVVMPSGILLLVILLSFILLSVILLSVIIVSSVILNVNTPKVLLY